MLKINKKFAGSIPTHWQNYSLRRTQNMQISKQLKSLHSKQILSF